MTDPVAPRPVIERAYAPSRFGQLHYRICRPTGPITAPPLLCLHQTPSSGLEWEVLMPGLAQGRVLIAPDTPGYGMSDAPPAPITIPDIAEVMLTLVDDLTAQGTIDGAQFDVMGMHTGSITGTQLGVSQPARVRKLVLFGLAAYPEDVRIERLATLRDKFPVPGPTLDHVEKLWAIIGQLGDVRQTAEDRHIAMAECLRLGTRMPWGYDSVYRYDFQGALDRLTQPALVVNPEDDLWIVTQENAPRIRNGQLWNIPGKAHGYLKYDHAEVVARIRAFLEQTA